MRWRPNASAAARASPPFWRRYDGRRSRLRKSPSSAPASWAPSIAAHVANAGVPVVLLDIVAKDNANRNAIAEGAVEKMLKTDPAPFMSKAAAKLVTTGNIEDDLDLLADCDWIIEAVIERLDVKQALYAKIEAARKPGSVVSSNTSTIPLAKLTRRPAGALRAGFRHHPFLQPAALHAAAGNGRRREDRSGGCRDACRASATDRLGKSVVPCKDRPGFIANRLGVYWLQTAVVDGVSTPASTSRRPTPSSASRWASRRPACSACSTWSAST